MSDGTGVVNFLLNNDVIELKAYDSLLWVTRDQFMVLEKKSRMLESMISGGADLSTIRHILDESPNLEETHSRFAQWVADTDTTGNIVTFPQEDTN